MHQLPNIYTEWGTVPYLPEGLEYGNLVLVMDALYTAGREWTKKNDPTRLHLVGGSAPF